MAQTVNLQPFTREASARFRANPIEICGGKSETEIHFPPRTSVSPFSIIPPILHNNFYINLLLAEGKAGEFWEHSNMAMLFHISNERGRGDYYNVVYSVF
jgi:hypothetical protein